MILHGAKSAPGNLATVRVFLGVAEVGHDLFLQPAVDEVLDPLGRIVYVIGGQPQVLDQICFPQAVRADEFRGPAAAPVREL